MQVKIFATGLSHACASIDALLEDLFEQDSFESFAWPRDSRLHFAIMRGQHQTMYDIMMKNLDRLAENDQ
jgi:hypothetical protein